MRSDQGLNFIFILRRNYDDDELYITKYFIKD